MYRIKDKLIETLTILVILATFVSTTWRSEVYEKNQNLRTAGFEILKNLGQLQIVVNYAHFQPDNTLGNPYLGWGHVALVSDLSQLMPEPIPTTIHKLVDVWGAEADNLKNSDEATKHVSHEVDASRQAVLNFIRSLH
jgi:hypothetical protein